MTTARERMKALWDTMTPEEREEHLQMLRDGQAALKNDPERRAKVSRHKSEAAIIRHTNMTPEERARINAKMRESQKRRRAGLPPKTEPVWVEEETKEPEEAPYEPVVVLKLIKGAKK